MSIWALIDMVLSDPHKLIQFFLDQCNCTKILGWPQISPAIPELRLESGKWTKASLLFSCYLLLQTFIIASPINLQENDR